jgi:type II secretory pathway predicted ATPase ExeA
MYENHFALQEKPFSLTPNPDFLYLSPKHKTGFAMLEYGLLEQAAGLTVITGEVGAGKTTLIQQLLRTIDDQQLTIGLINNTHNAFGDLLQWVALAFDLPHEGKDKVALFADIQQFMINEYASGRRAVLIVDEAQNIDAETLEELRLITNINANDDQLIQIVLVGQPELLETLTNPRFAQIAQRVAVEYHLEPLSCKETMNYITHRLEVAGGKGSIFHKHAMAAIYYFSGGVPRLINNLCDYALAHTYAQNRKRVNLAIAMEVVKGRRIGGVNHHVKDKHEAQKVRELLLELTGTDIAAAIR